MNLAQQMSGSAVLLVGVARELRNRLFSLTAQMDTLAAHGSLHVGDIAALREPVQRMVGLVRDLEELGLPIRTRSQQVSIASMISYVVRVSRREWAGSTVQLRAHVDPELAGLSFASYETTALIMRLAEHAIHRSPQNTVVQINVMAVLVQGESHLKCVVTDRGPTPGSKQSDELLIPFSTNGYCGFPLTIAQRYVVALGGQMSVVVQHGQGTTVSVVLPQSNDADTR